MRRKAPLGCYSREQGIFINIEDIYKLNCLEQAIEEDNIEAFVEQYVFTDTHEVMHAVLDEVVSSEACHKFDNLRLLWRLAL